MGKISNTDHTRSNTDQMMEAVEDTVEGLLHQLYHDFKQVKK